MVEWREERRGRRFRDGQDLDKRGVWLRTVVLAFGCGEQPECGERYRVRAATLQSITVAERRAASGGWA